MDIKRYTKTQLIYVIVVSIVLLLSGGAATYAWYSSNKTVDTNTLTASTSSDQIGIQLSSDGVHFTDAIHIGNGGAGIIPGGNGTGGNGNGGPYGPTGNNPTGIDATTNSCIIKTVNNSDLGFLLPVSTVDLDTFVTNNTTVDGVAKYFELVENEENIYHGRVYLRAVAENQPENSGMDLYLDEQYSAGGELVKNASAELIGASRLGLTFNGGNKFIFRMTDDAPDAAASNTLINGKPLAKGEVLGYQNGEAHAAKDPSKLLSDYAVQNVDGKVKLPNEALLHMDFNVIYTVDIYYYLEGCDPDCRDGIALENFDLHLSFFGVMS